METINDKITYLGYQEAKICEIENNKEKLQAAKKRMEILKKASKPISDNLLLAELLWLSLRSEMETSQNILKNISTERYVEENKQCSRNLVRTALNNIVVLIMSAIFFIANPNENIKFKLYG